MPRIHEWCGGVKNPSAESHKADRKVMQGTENDEQYVLMFELPQTTVRRLDSL